MSTVTTGAIALEDGQRAFTMNGQTVALTDTEFRVLKALASNAGSVVTRGELTSVLYEGKGALAKSNVLEVLVVRLRRKLADIGAPAMIQTTRSIGYSYVGAVQ